VTAIIDHLVYACPELGPEADRIGDLLGVRPAYGGRHLGLGTHNALLSLGPRTYLEIIAPDPGQPRPADPGAADPLPFGLDELSVPALRGWAAAPDDLDAAVSRSRAAGFDYGPVIAGQRRTADGGELSWRMTSSSLRPGAGITPFLIDWGESAHPAGSAPPGAALAEFSLRTPDPQRVGAQLAVLGLEAEIELADEPGLRATLIGLAGARLVLDS
jgi:Glyoxalase-like domain